MISTAYFIVVLVLETVLLVLCFIPKFRCFSLQTIIFYSCIGISAILYIVAAGHFIEDKYQKLNCTAMGVFVLCFTIFFCIIETVHFFIMMKSGHATEVLKISSAGKNESKSDDSVRLHNLWSMIYFLTIAVAVVCMVIDFIL